MFGRLGPGEIILIVIIALVVFGPKKLPELGRSIGKSLTEFRRATRGMKEEVQTAMAMEDDGSDEGSAARVSPPPSS